MFHKFNPMAHGSVVQASLEWECIPNLPLYRGESRCRAAPASQGPAGGSGEELLFR